MNHFDEKQKTKRIWKKRRRVQLQRDRTYHATLSFPRELHAFFFCSLGKSIYLRNSLQHDVMQVSANIWEVYRITNDSWNMHLSLLAWHTKQTEHSTVEFLRCKCMHLFFQDFISMHNSNKQWFYWTMEMPCIFHIARFKRYESMLIWNAALGNVSLQ